MVLSEELFTNTTNGLQSDRIQSVKFEDLSLGLFVKLCKACQLNVMAAIPPSAFSAGRIRETQQDMKLSNIKKVTESAKYFNTNLTELTPLKYNSKLMNSIWGIYNRYSPHNVKKINDASNSGLQQAGRFREQERAYDYNTAANLNNVWTTNFASQSH